MHDAVMTTCLTSRFFVRIITVLILLHILRITGSYRKYFEIPLVYAGLAEKIDRGTKLYVLPYYLTRRHSVDASDDCYIPQVFSRIHCGNSSDLHSGELKYMLRKRFDFQSTDITVTVERCGRVMRHNRISIL